MFITPAHKFEMKKLLGQYIEVEILFHFSNLTESAAGMLGHRILKANLTRLYIYNKFI